MPADARRADHGARVSEGYDAKRRHFTRNALRAEYRRIAARRRSDSDRRRRRRLPRVTERRHALAEQIGNRQLRVQF